ncbi:ribonucleotide-diphosphate reductase subunit beta [Nosocomiicoccus ampullae]|uniref:ribonucleotide-diphosphate reductase subunit beta n=1 Tax=Nosocomiicoccus ampullae TaxID=489910 RepID=UPI001C5FCF33|nr:ribonucleotide-diphosphate reductase subunit beta [Nosocomiicoccus ampullae]QYA47988.1 ribonucleotide-diphosphate reductase subunit beta [Nosocomiicoccus ampullae]
MVTQIKKRNGNIVNFDKQKIAIAIAKANKETNEDGMTVAVNDLVSKVIERLEDIEGIITVECIQDVVEDVLLDSDYKQTARAYIIYRERQKQKREIDIFSKRVEMKPFEYPELYQYVEAIRHSYWVHTEFNYTSDIQDYFNNALPHEKSAVTRAMLAIAQVEVAVKTFWGDIYHRMPKYEIGAVGASFSESEARHADAYSHLLEILGLNNEFEKIKEIPALKQRVDYLSKMVQYSKSEDDREYILSMILFSLFTEHVSLFSQFLVMMSFNKHRNLFKGLSNVIEATSKEEQIHGLFGIDVVNIIREEHPEWFNEDLKREVYKACQEAYESEVKVIDWILGEGELEFMSSDVVKEFVKQRLNNSLVAVGYEELFDVDKELVDETKWFDDEVIGTKLTDFLHKRSVNYTKFSQSINGDTIFSPQSDLKNKGKNEVNQTIRLRMLEL